MEITKELREKLLTANSEEEVKALLGDQATEEEKAKVWNEIQRKRSQENLEAADDDELEAVNGGLCIFNGEYASDGKEVGCLANDYTDWSEANKYCCPNNEAGGWKHEFVFDQAFFNDRHVRVIKYKCKKCSYTKVEVGH